MSREIKFKAFINGVMKDVTGLHYMGGSISEVQVHTGNLEFKWYNILDCKIMQFTGFKDKDGKEIYSGYICMSFDPDYDYKENKQIVFNDDCGQWWWGNDGGNSNALWEIDASCLVVIGNIYSNPDLLT